jgi:hypothetical protein
MTLSRILIFARRHMSAWALYRANKALHRVCPDIASVPDRDRRGRFVSSGELRKRRVIARLLTETAGAKHHPAIDRLRAKA